MTAPWTVVEGNDKWFARVKTLSTLVETLSGALDYRPASRSGAKQTAKKQKAKGASKTSAKGKQ